MSYFKNVCVICGRKTHNPKCCSPECQQKNASRINLIRYHRKREEFLANNPSYNLNGKIRAKKTIGGYVLKRDLTIRIDLTVPGKRGKLFPIEDDCRYDVPGLDYTRLNVGRQIQKNSREYEK
jgi:hypothetical protein